VDQTDTEKLWTRVKCILRQEQPILEQKNLKYKARLDGWMDAFFTNYDMIEG
jgi:hypothetical protein